ncbi:GGDEF domain-containing protein [Kordiimonas marina]|uniref:GGDEF domain-containing protein n=1 Tax=Kordiimonas marina TaxID=2872312 RepID=UPI001FF30FE5|nr:GGDEF domain-containing protein [Kordiimonas marina]MCJ9429198.1 GGDEF domain-containing protein [Kordiimonas marina]
MIHKEAFKIGLGLGAFLLVLGVWFAGQASPALFGLSLIFIGGYTALAILDWRARPKTTTEDDKLVNADMLPGALIVTSVNGKVKFLNRSAQSLFSEAPSSADIKPLFDWLHGNLEDRNHADQVLEAVLSAPEIQFTEMLQMRDGRVYERLTRPVEASPDRIWILRDLTHVQMANDDNAMHRSMLEADAARTAELAEQLFHAKAELEAKQAELTHLANTDSLTGLLNRRRFTALGEEAVLKAGDGEEIWVLMMDIDYFKRINDTYGHAAGDVAIRDFARIMEQTIADHGFIGRMGGEEFAIILPRATMDVAIRMAETIRRETARNQTVCDVEKFRFTASIGVAQWLPEEITIEPALDRADQALYSAKTYGRNRVVGFEYARV